MVRITLKSNSSYSLITEESSVKHLLQSIESLMVKLNEIEGTEEEIAELSTLKSKILNNKGFEPYQSWHVETVMEKVNKYFDNTCKDLPF